MNYKLDRRDDARIRRSALDEVRSIQALLADVYKDAGDGRTLLRELVQNADDARASRLVFVVLNQGWAESRNSLLRGAGFLAINDGAFTAKDRDALHQAIGGSKAEDAEKIGRFGIGLKSVFHICEAIVYVGAENGTIRPGALNPWAGTGLDGVADPLHPDWNQVEDEDVERLTGMVENLLGGFDKGLLLWIPLRCAEHLDRADDRPYGLGQFCPTSTGLRKWFDRPASLNLLLAQCGHLHSIEAETAATAKEFSSRTQIVRVVRPGFESGTWVGRRTQADWPRELIWIGGRCRSIPRKALAHAAITILRTDDKSNKPSTGVRIRWAVFLPLDDDPQPRQSSVVETVGSVSAKQQWEIILHGYFWPSQDRRSIPGVTDHDAGTGDSEVRLRWNRAVRDELLLPGLPGVLAAAVSELSESESREIVQAISESRVVRENLVAVTRRYLLLPLVTERGVNWLTADAATTTILSFPAWGHAPPNFRKLFPLTDIVCTDGVVFVAEDAPRIGGRPAEWPVEWFGRLLKQVPIETFQAPNELIWVANFVRHVLRGKRVDEDERAIEVAHWLAQKIAEDALSPTIEAKPEQRDELRSAWRQLLETLPESWLFDVRVECQRAVVELAADGIIGARFIPVPFGYRPDNSYGSRPDPDLLDRALSLLGRRLEVTEGVSQRVQRSRILFAENLLEIRGNRPLPKDLARLPLLRARRLPDDKDEGWSIDYLRQKVSQFRVFTRQRAQEETDDSIDSPSDP